MRHLRFIFVSLAIILTITLTAGNVNVSASSASYYLSGLLVNTNQSSYVCGDQVETSVVLYSANLTIPDLPVSLQVNSPSGAPVANDSASTNDQGVTVFSVQLPETCEIGIYTVTASSKSNYNSVVSNDKFSVSPTQDYVALKFDRLSYRPGQSVSLTGTVIADCYWNLINNQTLGWNVYDPNNAIVATSSAKTTGQLFLANFMLPQATSRGLYTAVASFFDQCSHKSIYGNAFFSVVSNMSIQPWGISAALSNSTFLVGEPIVITGSVTGGPYFYCQLGWTCTGNGTFPPTEVSIRVFNIEGSEVYVQTLNVGLSYYPPSYGFQDVLSGYVSNFSPGNYIVIVEASTQGYPSIQTAIPFTVTPRFM